jgi:Protein of unknown function (DUF3551)
MRPILFAGAIIGAVSVLSGTDAVAQYYPWCSIYSDKVGSSNCGFVSFQQCMANVRGIGGFCIANPWVLAYEKAPVVRTKRRY